MGTIFLLITLLVTDKLTCDGISTANTGSGGLLQGDPAPGRSPGPPPESGHHRTTEENPTILLTSSQPDDNCTFEGNVQYTAGGTNVTVQVTHPLFNTDVLVFGVVYQGKIFFFN